jgi:RNA polymerase sigma-70 factor (ECF subfamily)
MTARILESPESRLLGAAQAGDGAALEQLLLAHRSSVRARVAHHVPAQDVDDVLQEVWLAAVAGLRHFSGASSLRTWLLAIAHHKIADHYRRSGRDEPCGLLPGCRPGQDARARAEQAVLAGQLLAELSPRMRRVLALRLAEGRSFAEVAESLALSEEAAKSLYRRALGKCRRSPAAAGNRGPVRARISARSRQVAPTLLDVEPRLLG